MPIYEYSCPKCHKQFEILQSTYTPSRFKHCGVWVRRVISPIFAYKDKRFEFTRVDKQSNQVDITSQSSYRKFLKKNGLVSLNPKDLRNIKPNEKGFKQKSRQLAKQCVREIHKKGAMEWVLGRNDPNGRDKKEREVVSAGV